MKTRIAIAVALLACSFAFAEPIVTFGIGVDGSISLSWSSMPTTVVERRTIFSSTYNGITYYNEIPMFGLGYSLVTIGWGDFTAMYSNAYRADGGMWIVESMLPYRPIGRTVVIPPVLPPPAPRTPPHRPHRHGMFPPPPPPHHGRPFAPDPFHGHGKRR